MGNDVELCEVGCSSSTSAHHEHFVENDGDFANEPSSSGLDVWRKDLGTEPSTSYKNPLAGMFQVAEIPPFQKKKVHKIRKYNPATFEIAYCNPKLKKTNPELAEHIKISEQRRNVAWARACNLVTDEDLLAFPREAIPRSIPMPDDVLDETDDLVAIGDKQPILNESRNERQDGFMRRMFNERLSMIRNFFLRIRRIMSSFIEMYAPHADQYFGRTEEEMLAIDNHRRRVVPEMEKFHIHMLYMRETEYSHGQPAPYIESTSGEQIKTLNPDYLNFVMYNDLQPLVELKKIKEAEKRMAQNVIDSRKALIKATEELKRKEKLKKFSKIEESDEDDEDVSMPNDPLLDNKEANTHNK